MLFSSKFHGLPSGELGESWSDQAVLVLQCSHVLASSGRAERLLSEDCSLDSSCKLTSFFLVSRNHDVPQENKLNLYRLILWWLIGVVSLRQIYMYLANPKIMRLGSQAWMAIAIQITELLIVIKFGKGERVRLCHHETRDFFCV